MFAHVVISENDHGYEAGRYVASQALAAFEHPPMALIAFVTEQYHKPEEVVRGIRSINNTIPLYGSGATQLLTMAGSINKGVGIMALRLNEETLDGIKLALVHGSAEDIALRIKQMQKELPKLPRTAKVDETKLLTLESNPASMPPIDSFQQAVASQLSAECEATGVLTSEEQQNYSTMIFIDDQVEYNGMVLALFRIATGMGIGSSNHTDRDSATQEAARHAIEKLERGSDELTAVLVFVGKNGTDDGEIDMTALRDIVGLKTPLLGIVGNGDGVVVMVF